MTARALAQFRQHINDAFGGTPEDELAPIVVRYLLTVWLPQHPVKTIGEDRYRELRTWAEAIDAVLRGHSLQAADLMVQRFKSGLMTLRDGHSQAAKWLELLPAESADSALNVDEEELSKMFEAGELKLQQLEQKLRSG